MLVEGIPEYMRSDNGPEFVAKELRKWRQEVGAKTLYLEPRSPWENGYCESLNGKLRDECLNGEIFYSLQKARVVIEGWRVRSNTVRSHSSLGYPPPALEAVQRHHASCAGSPGGGPKSRQLVESEIDLHVHLHGYRDSVLAARFEPPLPNCFDCLFIETHTQGSLNANVMRSPVGPHNDPQHNRALELCLASFLGKLRVRSVDDTRRGHSSPNTIRPAPNAASPSWTHSRTAPRADTTAAAGTNATA
jgi:hypothetical protein